MGESCVDSQGAVAQFQHYFFHHTPTTEIYTLSLHDALPISAPRGKSDRAPRWTPWCRRSRSASRSARASTSARRSEEHTSELQSLAYLVCRLLLEKKNINQKLSLRSFWRELNSMQSDVSGLA